MARLHAASVSRWFTWENVLRKTYVINGGANFQFVVAYDIVYEVSR